MCQLINKLLGSLPENAQIEDELFDQINTAMQLRARDKVPNVRIQAVLALSRLQDPKDDQCPVVNGTFLGNSCGLLNLFLLFFKRKSCNILILVFNVAETHRTQIVFDFYHYILKLLIIVNSGGRLGGLAV